MIRLFRDQGCPYAHRVAALLHLLAEPWEDHSVPVGRKPAGLYAVSPSGRIPALSDAEVALYDSLVIGAYLSETRGWPGFAADPALRAAERLFCLRFDELVAGPAMRALPGAAAVDDAAIDELAHLAGRLGPPRLGWVALHVGPFALFLAEWAPPVERALRARPELGAWLAFGAGLEAVRETRVDLVVAPEFSLRRQATGSR